MPQCKKSDCREQAVPHGKRYCPRHLAEYKAKQRAYEAVAATLPPCADCGTRLSKARADAGQTICRQCEIDAALAEEQAEARAALAEEQAEARERRDQALQSCQTVEDLKGFIRDYIIC